MPAVSGKVQLRAGFARLTSLWMTCAGCGFEIQADFAFCPRCGAAQRPAAAPKDRPNDADRRPVTVLFADLCGFTSLSERLDPEEVRTFQGVLFDAHGQAVRRRGGFVAKYLGDAVLALFGAPLAHEDPKAELCGAALSDGQTEESGSDDDEIGVHTHSSLTAEPASVYPCVRPALFASRRRYATFLTCSGPRRELPRTAH